MRSIALGVQPAPPVMTLSNAFAGQGVGLGRSDDVLNVRDDVANRLGRLGKNFNSRREDIPFCSGGRRANHS